MLANERHLVRDSDSIRMLVVSHPVIKVNKLLVDIFDSSTCNDLYQIFFHASNVSFLPAKKATNKKSKS